MKIGILGGTFNPIHCAHLGIAREAQQRFGLDRVLFIPAADPPHKDVADEVSFEHRLAMVEAAIHGVTGFVATDLEMRRHGKSFSVDTLEILKHQYPQDTFYFIIGMDSYRDIATWKDVPRLFSLCHLVVTTRPGIVLPDPLEPLPIAIRKDFCYHDQADKIRHKSGHYVFFLAETQLDISSTDIRRKLLEGQPIEDLVPTAVAAYINQHQLYRQTSSPRSPSLAKP